MGVRSTGLPIGAFFLLYTGLALFPRFAGAGVLSGLVRDAATLAPVEGALIAATTDSGGPARPTLSDPDGRFSLASLPASSYTLRVSRLGYERSRLGSVRVAEDDSVELLVDLAPTPIRQNPVVVSASRRLEKALDAPASISVVTSRAIRERPSLTPADYVRALPGVDVANKGMTQTSVVARGFSSAQSNALLTLTDYRVASLPSLRYNLYNFIPIPADDIERIEVVRGPGAALYGPNCDRGVLHILTRSPFESPGTALSLTSGEREAAQGSFRHAGRLAESVRFALSGQYFRGRDWKFVDPEESASRGAALSAGADPDTLKIGRRDPWIERVSGVARAEWRRDEGTSAVLSGGFNRAIRNVDLTPVGAVQVRNWDSGFIQIRAARERLFGQFYVNAGGAGDSYFLRSGMPIVDRSRLWAGQVQHGVDLGSPQRLTFGIDVQRTDPRTGGTIHGRHESVDGITELGSYLHSESRLRPRLDLVAAIRVDHHSRFNSPVFSPRAGVVFRPAENQNVRVTLNRAYGTPGSDDLFADFVAGSLAPLPYHLRVEGVPKSGYTFERDCGGPCMRSPFTADSVGGPGAYLGLDATQEWPAVSALLRDRYPGLDSIPPPSPSQVATVLARLNATGSFDPVGGVADIPGLRPTITNTVEAGYKGLVAGRAKIALDLYRSWIHDWIGHLQGITPSVFLDKVSLEAYLRAQGIPSDTAAAIAAEASAIPVGTISPREALDPTDLIFSVRNFGDVAIWGMDTSIMAELDREWSLGASYSWMSRDLFSGLDGLEEIALDAPARKGSLVLAYRGGETGFTGLAEARYTSSFPVISGVYMGRVSSYTLLDLRFLCRVPGWNRVTLSVSADNLFDVRHREFLGSPEIGRLVLVRLRTEL